MGPKLNQTTYLVPLDPNLKKQFGKIRIKNYNKSCKLYQKLNSTEGADIQS